MWCIDLSVTLLRLKLALPRLIVLFAIFTASSAVLAESYETVSNAIFKTDDGKPTTLLRLGTNDARKGFLVMFWAGWCVPCKEELALVVRQGQSIENWNFVAVNVDDSGGRTRADGILKSLHWPYYTLNDEGGALFYQINSSGELPLALAFDPDGHLLEVIRELNPTTLVRLSTTQFTASTRRGWEVSDEFHYIQRLRTGGTSDVGANTSGVRYTSNNWQVGATHNLIRQRRDPATGWSRFEDEIGPSYLQWQGSGSSGITRLRAGDDYVEWGRGALISARAIPGTDTNASLQGAHYSQTSGEWSIMASAGRVRQQLFGLLLDPTVDLTQELPVEKAYGAVIANNHKFISGLNTKVAVGALGYRRDALAAVSTSFLTPYEDHRLHANVGASQDTWGLDVAQTHYFITESQTPDHKNSDSSQVDGYIRSGGDSKYQLGMTYLEKRDTVPRTFTPVLTEYPATPLTNDGLRSWRLAPRVTLKQWMIEPQWIGEQSTRSDDYEKQNSYVLSVLRPDLEFKSILLYQKHGSNPLNIDADQSAAVLASALTESLSGQLEYKFYKAKGRDGATASDQGGQSAAVQLTVKIDRALQFSQLGRLQFSVTRTQQDGYYLSTSGIDRKELTGYRLTWTRDLFEIRVAACQEPGGLVCSGGVCAQRPPLNGFAVESAVHVNF